MRWPQSVATLLQTLKVVNFDMNLMLFDCSLLHDASDESKFVYKWVLFLLLPIIISLRYFGEVYVRQWWSLRSGKPSTFLKQDAIKASMFMTNLLYLGVTASILSVFSCEKLGDSTTYYLVAQPTIECYSGAHLGLLVR